MSNKYVERLLQTARAEIGYVEKKSNKDLDSKTANSGKNNYTKYGRDMKNWTNSGDTYGIAYQWCDQFYDWIICKTFGIDMAKRLLIGWSAYTPTSAKFYKDRKQWHTGADVQAGDQIFFKNSVRIHHTGIVEKVEGGYVYTIEGNTNPGGTVVSDGGEVARKKYKIGSSSIAGYGRPLWYILGTADTTTPGWYEDSTGKWYRHTKGTGKSTYYHGIIKEIDGRVYCFNEDGYVVRKNKNLIHLDLDTGELTFRR